MLKDNRNVKLVDLRQFGELLMNSEDINKLKEQLNGKIAGYSRGRDFNQERIARIRAFRGLLDVIK
jgi:hypothetical protein